MRTSALAALTLGLALLAGPVLAQQTAPAAEDVPLNNIGGRTEAVSALSGRGAFISQIGDANRARIDQTGRAGGDAYARISQDGSGNSAAVDQQGAGGKYADVAQDGDRNLAEVVQGGDAATVVLTQSGSSNRAFADQQSSGGFSGAVLAQAGSGNEMRLLQSSGDNHAVLRQEGSDNRMTLTQSGGDNRAMWTQIGSGLPDLNITQDGGMRMNITQTSGAK